MSAQLAYDDDVYSETLWWTMTLLFTTLSQHVPLSVAVRQQLHITLPQFPTGNYPPLPPTYIPMPGLKVPSSWPHMTVTQLGSASNA